MLPEYAVTGLTVGDIECEHFAGDVLSHRDDLGRVLESAPGRLRHGDEADAGEDGMLRPVVQIDEDVETLDSRHGAEQALPRSQCLGNAQSWGFSAADRESRTCPP
jgi:hypothetical protein